MEDIAPVAGREDLRFTRLDYRRTTAWPERIRREWPFIRRWLEEGPDGWVVDVGCGSGEHARHIAREGYRVLGIDPSTDAIRLATESGPPPLAYFAVGRFEELPLRPRTPVRLIICIGNTLVLLGDDDRIRRAIHHAHDLLRPGGALIIQVLNYEMIRTTGLRYLPVNFRKTDAGELVYVRLMDPLDDEKVLFHVITLERGPGEAVAIRRSVRHTIRSIRPEELREVLHAAGFRRIDLYGDYNGTPLDPEGSVDVIAVAVR